MINEVSSFVLIKKPAKIVTDKLDNNIGINKVKRNNLMHTL